MNINAEIMKQITAELDNKSQFFENIYKILFANMINY